LKVFCAVIESGGFTRAATRLYVAQSAVSSQIRQLERELGTVLFNRNSSGVRPTQSGELLYEYARQLLSLAEEAQEQVSALEASRAGRVRIGVSDLCAQFLPSALADFSEHYPSTEVSVVAFTSTSALLDRLLGDRVDFALLSHRPEVPALCLSPIIEVLPELICRRDHILARNTSVTVHQLSDNAFASYHRGNALRQVLDGVFATSGLRPRICIESNYMAPILQAVEAGTAVTLLPRHSVAARLAEGGLVALPVEGVRPVEIVLATRRSHALSGPARRFTETLASAAEAAIHMEHPVGVIQPFVQKKGA
jgi:DNA-binding transcriptional LysR family regulator